VTLWIEGLLNGLDKLVSHETGIVVHIAEDPLSCVVLGTGRILEDYGKYSRVFSGGTINV
jgi:rod shape-determining protein MreB and related proteins